MEEVDRIFRYIHHTSDLSLTFRGGYGIELFAMVDASYAENIDRKSQSGMCFFLSPNSGSIFSSSKKQKCVSLSSTEAEYIALCEGAKSIVWFRMFLEELGFKQSNPTVVYEDNKSTIAMLQDRKLSKSRTKHIVIRYHYIREKVLSKEIEVRYLHTDSMIADMCTKSLNKSKFLPFRDGLLGYYRNIDYGEALH